MRIRSIATWIACSALLTACTSTPSPPTSPSSAIPVQLRAFGTEPFWSIAVDGAAMTWTTPENAAGTRLTARRTDTANGARFEAGEGGERYVLTIGPGPCSDGMSDRTHAYTATWTVGARTERGCANPGLTP